MLKFPNPKDDSSELDYICDWSDWLNGDTIVDSWWAIPQGLTTNGDAHNNTVATIWIDCGEVGKTYTIKNHITTAAGLEDERSITLRVKNI